MTGAASRGLNPVFWPPYGVNEFFDKECPYVERR